MRDLADELVVFDSFSTDRTVEIARSGGARILQNAFQDFARQRNAALDSVTTRWVLMVDADERLTPALCSEIADLLATPMDFDAYSIRRLNFFRGKPAPHWDGGLAWRLFRRDRCRYDPSQLVHEKLVVEGSRGSLRNLLEHYTFQSFDQYLPKLSHYSSLAAHQAFAEKKRARWYHLALFPPYRFFKSFLLNGGFLDGAPGLMIACLSACATALKYAGLQDLESMGESRRGR